MRKVMFMRVCVVVLYRTGSNETVNSVVRTIGPGGPGNETVLVADAPVSHDAGAEAVAPPISVCACTVVLSYGGWVICIWIVYTL